MHVRTYMHIKDIKIYDLDTGSFMVLQNKQQIRMHNTCISTYIPILILCRKSIFQGTHNFIHLNMSVSLIIGLIIFVSGIETAKDIKVIYMYYCFILKI